MPTLIVSTVTNRPRFRAGFQFAREPSIVECTEEQEAAIRADSRLCVHGDRKPAASEPTPAVVAGEAPTKSEKSKR